MKTIAMLKILVGFMALMLAAVGVLLPVWPTTPFVLVAIGCFGATPTIQAKIMRIKFFRDYYESYTQKKRLPIKTIIISLCFLWIMLVISMIAVQNPFTTIVLAIIGILVTIHIIIVSRIKMRKKGSEKLCDKE